MLQNIFQMQNQKAAVGTMQRACLDQSKIRDQSSHFRFALHASKQIRARGMVFDDNRSAVGFTVVHEQIDVVNIQIGFGMGLPSVKHVSKR